MRWFNLNKFRAWFYNKTKKKMEQEMAESGLSIMDNEKYEKIVMKRSRTDMIYTTILIIIAILIIYKWLRGAII